MQRLWVSVFAALVIVLAAPAASACDTRIAIGLCWDDDGVHVKGGPVFGPIGVIIAVACVVYACWSFARRRR
jgi:hypothetical protein